MKHWNKDWLDELDDTALEDLSQDMWRQVDTALTYAEVAERTFNHRVRESNELQAYMERRFNGG